jgi:short-subunit dehydrogenase
VKILVLGATSAIAQAAARVWAARGEELTLVARSPEKLQAVADDLRARGGKVETIVHDLNDRAFVPPPADVVLLAHGVLGGPETLDTNLAGPIALLEKLADLLLPGACIAALSSVSGDRGRAKNPIYAASKAGLDAYLSALRQRLFRKGIRVVTLKPGFVDTPMTAQMPKTPLFAQPATIGRGIVRAIDRRADVVYLPWWWRFIMLVVRIMPEALFKRMSF